VFLTSIEFKRYALNIHKMKEIEIKELALKRLTRLPAFHEVQLHLM
jgi:hypothetical protein